MADRTSILAAIDLLGGHWWVARTDECTILHVEIPGFTDAQTYEVRAWLVAQGLADTTTAKE